jgi:outer membrane protein OmpA-like peptidoglycan-associated protein/tetratricopeptide (TPR) repeat protein
MRVFRYSAFLFSFLVLLQPAYSQSWSIKRHARSAENNFAFNKYDKALPHYLYLLDIDSTNFDYNFKAGICYLALPSHKDESVKYFTRASKAKVKDTVPDLYYYLGLACQRTDRFDEALAAYRTLERLVGTDVGLISLQQHIDACIRGKEMKLQPVNVDITNLGPSVNSDYPDYAPVMSADESTLIFTSKRKGSTGGKKTEDFYYYEDVYISHRMNEDEWTRSSKMDSTYKHLPFLKHFFTKAEKIPQVNTNDHDACIALTPDGKRLYLSRGGEVYYSDLTDGKWSSPSKMENFSHDKKDQEPSLTLSSDGKTMFVVSDRKGGYGGKDIYKATIQNNGKWGDLINLGPEINSELDEDSPFIQADTLYFSSQGHNSIGGYDVFKTVNRNGNWSAPENLGSPINTGGDDVFFIVNKKGDRAYYASEGNHSLGDLDIFAVDFAEPNPKIKLNLVAFGADPLKRVQASVRISGNDRPDSTLILGTSNTGIFTVKPGSTIRLDFHSEGCLNRSVTLKLPMVKRTSHMLVEAELKPQKDMSGKTVSQTSTFYIIRADLHYHQLTDSALAQRTDRKAYWQKTLGTTDTNKIAVASYTDHADTLSAAAIAASGLLTNGVNDNGENLASKKGTSLGSPSDTASGAAFRYKPITFGFSEKNLLKESTDELNDIANYMKKHPESKISIDGYTDSKGSDSYNQVLSSLRAAAALLYLNAKGVKSSRMHAQGHGKNNPLAPNEHPDGSDNPEGRQQNRRVEFTLLNGR